MNKNEPSKNNEVFRKRYFSMMTARIMAEESKRLSISPTEKDTWQELREKVRKIVKDWYRTKTFEELMDDLKRYNIKNPFQLASSTPDNRNFADNHDLCYRLLDYIGLDRVKWVEHRRRELLGMVTKQMCRIESVFTDMGIWAYHKCPFVIDGKVYFAAMYLPESRVIIEVSKHPKKDTEAYRDEQGRLWALKSVCDKLIVLDDDVYSEARIKRELVPQCAKNVILGPLGQPMNKIV